MKDFFNKYLIEKNHKKDSLIFSLRTRNSETQNDDNPIKEKKMLNFDKINQYQKTLINNFEHNLEFLIQSLMNKNLLRYVLSVSYQTLGITFIQLIFLLL